MKFFAALFIFYFSLLAVVISCAGITQNENEELQAHLTQKEIDELYKRDQDLSDVITFTRDEFRGMKLFMHNCNKCHPAGEEGKGPSLNDKNLPNFLIHFQVRSGRGDMPAFTKEEISKDELKRIILFVKLLREHDSD